ncbi:MAG: hypothetical protein WCF84_09895 [Anaerolineae bacterium]
MTSYEWSLVKRLGLVVLIAALFPIGALVYRLVWGDTGLTTATTVPTPAVYTLAPVPTTVIPLTTPSPSAVILVIPSGWNELTVPEENFAIAIPPRWQRLPVNPQELDASLKVIRQSNPELANALGARGQELMASGVKLWAFDFDPISLQSKFATNLTVTRQTVVDQVSLDTYVNINVSQIEQLTSKQGTVDHERLTLGDLPAERVRYNISFQASDGSTGTSAITQYLMIYQDNAFVLTYATLLDQQDKYKSIFDQSAASFRAVSH